jgi:Family of unknown function (DUF5678)
VHETNDDTDIITIKAKDPKSNWAAVDENGKVIAEGETPQDVISKLNKVSDNFSLVFIPKEGNTYIL